MILKYARGHWQWHDAKFDIYPFSCVWVNPKVNVFNKPWHLTNKKHVNYLPWIHTRVTQFTLCKIFLMYVATTQLHRIIIQNTQFPFYISDASVTLKVSQSSSLNDNVTHKQGDNHAQFEKSCINGVQEKSYFNGVQEKSYINFLFKQGNMSIISLEHVRKSKIVVCSWSTSYNQQTYKVLT